jgi:hypothetical protein
MVESRLTTLKKILTGEYTYIASVVSVNESEGTSIVETENGNQVKVNGTNVAAGNKALVKNGVIISQAPNNSYFEFTI